MTTTRWPNRYWGSQEPPKSKAEFFNAVTAPAPADGDVGTGTLATIRMYGPIDSWGGWWGISAKDVGQVLDALPDSVSQVILRINSPGGECSEAAAILNMLRAHKAKVTAVVDGLAASAASVIAAGCDETVMSPGTQMMIHSPWNIIWGNAADMRKEAAVLDNFEAAIIEIYEGKAGAKNWAELLAEETWLTGAQALELGLSDRTAVIPDAGEAETAGDDVVVVVPLEDDGDAEDSASADPMARATRITIKAAVTASQAPVSTEPGEPIRKENVVAYDDLKAGLQKRLGVTHADASDETLLTALDQALEEQAEPPAASAITVPEGAVLMDAAALADLRADAAAGREARNEQTSQRRDDIISNALTEGRIASASAPLYRAQLDKDEDGITALLASFPKSSAVPVDEIGHSDTLTSAEDSLYGAVYNTAKEA